MGNKYIIRHSLAVLAFKNKNKFPFETADWVVVVVVSGRASVVGGVLSNLGCLWNGDGTV